MNTKVNNELDKPFTWRTHTGVQVAPRDMKTAHLFYSIRFVYNHSVPEELKLPNCLRWTYRAPAEYRIAALKALIQELKTRQDLEPFMWRDLATMRNNLRRTKLLL